MQFVVIIIALAVLVDPKLNHTTQGALQPPCKNLILVATAWVQFTSQEVSDRRLVAYCTSIKPLLPHPTECLSHRRNGKALIHPAQ